MDTSLSSTNYLKNSFSYSGAVLCSSLPAELQYNNNNKKKKKKKKNNKNKNNNNNNDNNKVLLMT